MWGLGHVQFGLQQLKSGAINIFSPQTSRVKAEFEKDLVNYGREYNVII